jgi:hypothetical protein
VSIFADEPKNRSKWHQRGEVRSAKDHFAAWPRHPTMVSPSPDTRSLDQSLQHFVLGRRRWWPIQPGKQSLGEPPLKSRETPCSLCCQIPGQISPPSPIDFIVKRKPRLHLYYSKSLQRF